MAILHTSTVSGPRRDFSPYLSKITSLPIDTVLDDIRNFKFDATNAVAAFNQNQPHQKSYLEKLVEGGIYPIILGHLKRCEDETWADVLGEDRVGRDEFIDSPLVWVVFLTNSLNLLPGSDTRTRVEIAENIGPLFNCFRDDVKRELFGEQKFWYETCTYFQGMLLNVATKSRRAMDILLQEQKLDEMLIHTLFWHMYRPDIMEDELAKKYFSSQTFSTPMNVLYNIVAKVCNQIDDNGENKHVQERLGKDEMKELSDIGFKVIVSEAYDPTCDITFMAGLLDLIKLPDQTAKQIWYYMLHEMVTSCCVDSRVIYRTVCHGYKSSSLDHIDASTLPRVLYPLLHKVPPGDKLLPPLPDDTRYAIAIDAGLLQMCMGMILRFESLYTDDLYRVFLTIIEGANAMAFHPKTQKAIAKVNKAELRRILSKPELHSLGERNALCDKIFGTIAFFSKDIAPLEGPRPDFGGVFASMCSFCSKELGKDAIKRCGQCKKRIYCSRECQTNDWKKGHKKECKLLLQQDAETTILGSDKNKLKIQKQADKVLSAAKDMFFEHTPVVLVYANINDWDILDCVVVINFCVSPPSFEVELATDFLRSFTKESYQETLKKYIEETRSEGALVINIMFNPATGQPGNKDSPFVNIQMNMPGSNMPQGSWPAAQKSCLQEMKEDEPDWQGPGHAFAMFAPGVRLTERFVRDAM